MKLSDEELKRLKLSYPPPVVKWGDELVDVQLGTVTVGRYSDSPLPWPCRLKTGPKAIILDATLARMIATESGLTVMAALDVSETTVWRWRKFLGVNNQNNPGSKRLYQENYRKKVEAGVLDPRGGARNASRPEVIAKQRETRRLQQGNYKPHPGKIHWTPEMDALLGLKGDEKVGKELGISKKTVAIRRKYLGIPSFREVLDGPDAVYQRQQGFTWMPEQDALLGTMFDGELAELLGVSKSAVQQRRQILGIPAHSL